MAQKYDLIVYVVLTNPYARLVRVIDGQIWDVAAGALSRTTAWGDSDIALAKDAYIGGIPVTIPADLPDGDYDILFYDAASPADTDAVSLGKRIVWTGRSLMGLPQDI